MLNVKIIEFGLFSGQKSRHECRVKATTHTSCKFNSVFKIVFENKKYNRIFFYINLTFQFKLYSCVNLGHLTNGSSDNRRNGCEIFKRSSYYEYLKNEKSFLLYFNYNACYEVQKK